MVFRAGVLLPAVHSRPRSTGEADVPFVRGWQREEAQVRYTYRNLPGKTFVAQQVAQELQLMKAELLW